MNLSFQTQCVVFISSQGNDLDAGLSSPIRRLLPTLCLSTALRAPRITSPPLKSAAHWPRGVTMLRFDFTGFGNSEGDVADTNFSSNFADVIYAADYQREHHGAPKVLVDHSLGEIVALAAAQQVA
jgi:hypothetical protein